MYWKYFGAWDSLTERLYNFFDLIVTCYTNINYQWNIHATKTLKHFHLFTLVLWVLCWFVVLLLHSKYWFIAALLECHGCLLHCLTVAEAAEWGDRRSWPVPERASKQHWDLRQSYEEQLTARPKHCKRLVCSDAVYDSECHEPTAHEIYPRTGRPTR